MDFVNSFKSNFFQIQEYNFREYAIRLFRYQAENNEVYKNYLSALNIKVSEIDQIQDIPFMPIIFFRDFDVKTGNFTQDTTFLSSGTTASVRSRHIIEDLNWYKLVAETGFERFYGPLKNYTFLAFLPSYLENPHSSLIYMIRHFMEKADKSSGFVADEAELVKKVEKAGSLASQVLLIGVSYALLDLAEKQVDLQNAIVFETGGMKGRREELIRQDLHERLCNGLNIPSVHSEYGMTELLSQAWSKGDGIFQCPPWMKVLVREVNDPFSVGAGSRSGGVNIIDLANIHSCAFIETQDVGRVHADGSFEVQGRMDNAEVRGCSLMYV